MFWDRKQDASQQKSDLRQIFVAKISKSRYVKQQNSTRSLGPTFPNSKMPLLLIKQKFLN